MFSDLTKERWDALSVEMTNCPSSLPKTGFFSILYSPKKSPVIVGGRLSVGGGQRIVSFWSSLGARAPRERFLVAGVISILERKARHRGDFGLSILFNRGTATRKNVLVPPRKRRSANAAREMLLVCYTVFSYRTAVFSFERYWL